MQAIRLSGAPAEADIDLMRKVPARPRTSANLTRFTDSGQRK